MPVAFNPFWMAFDAVAAAEFTFLTMLFTVCVISVAACVAVELMFLAVLFTVCVIAVAACVAVELMFRDMVFAVLRMDEAACVTVELSPCQREPTALNRDTASSPRSGLKYCAVYCVKDGSVYGVVFDDHAQVAVCGRACCDGQVTFAEVPAAKTEFVAGKFCAKVDHTDASNGFEFVVCFAEALEGFPVDFIRFDAARHVEVDAEFSRFGSCANAGNGCTDEEDSSDSVGASRELVDVTLFVGCVERLRDDADVWFCGEVNVFSAFFDVETTNREELCFAFKDFFGDGDDGRDGVYRDVVIDCGLEVVREVFDVLRDSHFADDRGCALTPEVFGEALNPLIDCNDVLVVGATFSDDIFEDFVCDVSGGIPEVRLFNAEGARDFGLEDYFGEFFIQRDEVASFGFLDGCCYDVFGCFEGVFPVLGFAMGHLKEGYTFHLTKAYVVFDFGVEEDKGTLCFSQLFKHPSGFHAFAAAGESEDSHVFGEFGVDHSSPPMATCFGLFAGRPFSRSS